MNEENNPPSIEPETKSELSQETKWQEEAKEYKDKYLRLLAEMDNTRKRLQKEKLETAKYSIDSAMADLLQPIDNLENALKFTDQLSPEVKNWATGFQMILSQLKDVLHSHGIIAFASEGTDFDPHKHEAVEMEETNDYPEGIVIKEFVRGYKSGDRTIRPARVKVSKKPQETQANT